MAESVEVLDIDLSQLNEETEQTTKTLNELRKEVKALRDALGNATIGTEDFEKTLGELESKQQELASVTKSTNKAMEGSYEDLAQQMSALKKEWKSTNDVTERNEIGTKISALNEQLKAMDASIGNYQRNVGNYSSALSGLSGVINDTSNATQGVVSMFSSAVMVMGSMGVESDELSKILQKVQMAMILTKGLKDLEKGRALFERLTKVVKGTTAVQSLFNNSLAASTTETQALTGAQTANTVATTGATAATNAFRTALISTGIGAIVVAIGALIANLDKLTAMFKSNEAEADKYKNTMTELNTEFENMDDNLERDVRLMKAQGASIDEIHAKQLKNLELQREMIAAKMRSIALDVAQLQANRHWFDGGDKKIKNWKEAYDELAESYKSVSKAIKDLNADFDIDKQIELIEKQKDAYDSAANAARQAQQEFTAYLKTRNTNQKKLNDLQEQASKAFMGERDLAYADAKMWAEAEIDTLNDLRKEELKSLKKAVNDKVISQEEYERRRLSVINNYAVAAENVQTIYNSKVKTLNDKFRKEEEERDKKDKERKIKDLEDVYNAEIRLLDAQYNEAASRYELLDDRVGLSKANEDFLNNQLVKLQTLRNAVLALGGDVSEIDLQISDVLLQQQEAFVETFQAKSDRFAQLTDQMSDSITRLTSIGQGMSSEWASVFETMSNGIENVTNQLKKGEKGWRSYGVMAVSAMNVASSMMVALADEQDESSKEGFESQKKFQIAAATMSMLSGIVDAWVSAMNPANAWMTIWGQSAAGAAMTAMIAAMGIMQINKIKQQKYGGSTSDSGANMGATIAVPSISALQSMDSGVDATSVIQGASTEGQVADSKVYVTETDISNTMTKVNVVQSEATF